MTPTPLDLLRDLFAMKIGEQINEVVREKNESNETL